jgi:hypothetical protein
LFVTFADTDGDGPVDLATATRQRVQLYVNDGGCYGKPVFNQRVDDGIDVEFGDADGDLDTYIQTGGEHDDQLFLNRDGGRDFQPGRKLKSPPAALAIPSSQSRIIAAWAAPRFW